HALPVERGPHGPPRRARARQRRPRQVPPPPEPRQPDRRSRHARLDPPHGRQGGARLRDHGEAEGAPRGAAQVKKSEQALTIATAVVLGIAAGWTWVAKPLIEDYTNARDRVERAQDQLARAQEILKRRKEVESERASILGALAQDGEPIAAFLNH